METCFNAKLEKVFPLHSRDARLENFWNNFSGSDLKKSLSRRKKQTDRFRYMTRGETFKSESDIQIVKDHAEQNPDVKLWIPTRAWRKASLWGKIVKELGNMKNIFLCLSFDPSNTVEEWKWAEKQNLTIMFYGDDSARNFPIEAKRKACPKTWAHKDGHCAKCRGNCFSRGLKIVHLKQH